MKKALLYSIVFATLVLATVHLYHHTDAVLLKRHHTIDDRTHVTGKPDSCSVMGGEGDLMYIDMNNNDVHDHASEQVLCVPKM
jgi:hypothetical protein